VEMLEFQSVQKILAVQHHARNISAMVAFNLVNGFREDVFLSFPHKVLGKLCPEVTVLN